MDNEADHSGSSVEPNHDGNRDSLRKKTIDEILDSEKKYLAQLSLLIEHFVEPLCDSKIIPSSDATTIFSNVGEIKLVSEMLLSELHRTSVGEAFVCLCPFLKQYAHYASNYQRAMDTLSALRQKLGPFADFLQRQERKPELQGLKLISLLIVPVQRVPRYKLLLDRLLSYTTNCCNQGSMEKLQDAVRQVTEVTEYVNRQVSVYASMQRAVEIQRCLTGSDGVELLKPWRALLKEGILKKASEKSGHTSERAFFLFTDVLMYAKCERGGSYSNVTMMELKCTYVSRGAGVRWSDGGNGTERQLESRSFRVSCKGKKLLLVVQRETEAIAWVDAIQAAISECRQCQQSLRRVRPHSDIVSSPTLQEELVTGSASCSADLKWKASSVPSGLAFSEESCAVDSSKSQTPMVEDAHKQQCPGWQGVVPRSALVPLDNAPLPRAAPRRRRHRSEIPAESSDKHVDQIPYPYYSSAQCASADSSPAGLGEDGHVRLHRARPRMDGTLQPHGDESCGSEPIAAHDHACVSTVVTGRWDSARIGASCPDDSSGTAADGALDANAARSQSSESAAAGMAAGAEARGSSPKALKSNDDTWRHKWKKKCALLAKAGQLLGQVVVSPVLPSPQPPIFSPQAYKD